MKYSEAKYGRIFIIRLENGDIIHQEIEKFALSHSIRAAGIIILGGIDRGSRLITGPQHDRNQPIQPMEIILNHVHEATGTGTLFPDETGKPVLHMHLGCGRKRSTVTGCIRRGVKVWHIMEVILFELVNTTAERKYDNETGFHLLHPQ